MVYVGQTKDMKIRDQKHCSGSKTKIDRAIKRFGREKFSLIIITASHDKKEIELAEIAWIAQARHKLGRDMVYNVSNGGLLVWLGMRHNQFSIRKMKFSHKGLHVGSKHNMFGKNHSLESKKLISINRKGKRFGEDHPNSKLSIDEVNLIKMDLRSERTLAKVFNVSRSTINSIRRGINWKSK